MVLLRYHIDLRANLGMHQNSSLTDQFVISDPTGGSDLESWHLNSTGLSQRRKMSWKVAGGHWKHELNMAGSRQWLLFIEGAGGGKQAPGSWTQEDVVLDQAEVSVREGGNASHPLRLWTYWLVQNYPSLPSIGKNQWWLCQEVFVYCIL